MMSGADTGAGRVVPPFVYCVVDVHGDRDGTGGQGVVVRHEGSQRRPRRAWEELTNAANASGGAGLGARDNTSRCKDPCLSPVPAPLLPTHHK